MNHQTIAAIATASGPGGIGVIRISGSDSQRIATALTGVQPSARHAHFCSIRDSLGHTLDTGILLFFPGPHSFTGEDVIELQVHGSPVLLDMILREICLLGARHALPGEFSQRAFLNDKLDLAQAEAIADLINASTEQAALNATRSLQGVFSAKIDALVKQVTDLRVYVEAAIDFPEEEIDFLGNNQVASRLQEIQQQFQAVHGEAVQGTLIQEGMKLVIAGRPNAGKSSLLNALSGQDTAIISPIEGTTRDVLRVHIQIDGMPLHIVDTAGLRESDEEIEREGIRRAWAEIRSADRILLVVDSSDSQDAPAQHQRVVIEQYADQILGIPVTLVNNKCDLSNRKASIEASDGITSVHLSAKTGAGLELLRNHLKSCMGYREGAEGTFSARRRHLLALERAGQCLQNGKLQLLAHGAGELLAEDLRQCQNYLGEITGAVSSDDLLGSIFSSFCIGK